MFERFTDSARSVVVRAQEQARQLHSAEIDSAHLLLGIAADYYALSARVLREAGAPYAVLRDRIARHGDGLDAEALAMLGIDVEQVRSKVEREFGRGALDARPKRWPRGHIPFTRAAKKSLECALREAVHRKDNSIEDLHLLLGIIRADPETVEQQCGLDAGALRAAAHAELGDQAA
ncbi:Clp protease N-terminal domain-containing protein [Sciscionella sediminilitoris]|uniref:Clp protease N-terminal domain-containing protein n=1 Tax=Sciscionella sediminilitoris TaxID=1445613 RepID=UPI0004DF8ADF|nr:Clp protease N-terminal domain-containing protein [Sciscionella sp. SE31]